ncbi:MAG: response regulator transcription factor, partial [Cyanobacteria bacterium NC_groundwater_1444_Ag_S-0.65um_54_12]|nr:response regulator transcription factor [Cyanobacteria bacterium NC_groundwater_1444_Ag_S-0.65um_54_12]
MPTGSNARILVVEDEPDVRNLLEVLLAKEGYQVLAADNGEAALDILDQAHPDLVVTDVMMAKLDGLELCRRIRQQPAFAALPILLLTAKQEPSDKYRGFTEGADDYLTKPFDPIELLLRVKAQLRRTNREAQTTSAILKIGSLALDCSSYAVQTADRHALLTRSEFAILHYLLSNLDQLVASRILLSEALGYSTDVGSADLVRTHIRNIRKKIEADSANPAILL